MIGASQKIFKATIFAYAIFINKLEGFAMIRSAEISSISLKWYFDTFIFSDVL